jgi:UDP-glucuronate 4-epimerase
MSNYLVTGAAGFIASRVCEKLLDAGHQVAGIDNLDSAYDIRLKKWRLDRLMKNKGFVFHQDDICNRPALESIIKETQPLEAIINLAAKAGVRDSVLDPWSYYDTNLTGTLNLLELCQRNGIPKFILASTSSIYGNNAPIPTPEDADSSHPLQPYAASKKAAEVICHSHHYLYGLDVTVVRYFTVYGPAGRPGMSMFRFTQWISEGKPVIIYGDGRQTRGFTYLDDIAAGTILALKPLGYEIINLGGHQTIAIIDLVHRLEEIIGKQAVIEYQSAQKADMSASWADTGKAKQLLGWQPQMNLEAGLPLIVDWYRQNRSWASQVDTRG